MGADPTPRPTDPRVRLLADAMFVADVRSEPTYATSEEAAAAVLARLDDSNLVVATVPQLRNAVEAHEEWAGKGRDEPSSPDCGQDTARRLRARREAQGGG